MQGMFILGIWTSYLVIGFVAPFVFGLGYIWVDLFYPQLVSPRIMGALPVSFVMAAGAVLAYLLGDRRAPPRLTAGILLLLLWALWITLTSSWAELPDDVWSKWNWAVKTVLFAAFMPFLFRSRVQIEAALLTILLAIGANALTFGAKTVLMGGGYDRALGLLPVNVGLGEGSTLAIDCISCIPFLLFLRRHSLIVPRTKLFDAACSGGIMMAVLAAMGTYARAGLISLGVYAVLSWWRSKHKLVLAAAFVAAGAGLFAFMGPQWSARMNTIDRPEQESSALGRLLVWEWTLDYVSTHPWGGGFEVYKIDRNSATLPDGSLYEFQGKAFHSIYFEVLGEHGIVGAGIFLSMMATFYLTLLSLIRRTKHLSELDWLQDLARAMLVSATTYFCGSAFVGVAFQPFHYYLFAFAISASQYYARIAGAKRHGAHHGRAGMAEGSRVSAPAVPRTGLPRAG